MSINFCYNCGEKVEGKTRSCENCGCVLQKGLGRQIGVLGKDFLSCLRFNDGLALLSDDCT